MAALKPYAGKTLFYIRGSVMYVGDRKGGRFSSTSLEMADLRHLDECKARVIIDTWATIYDFDQDQAEETLTDYYNHEHDKEVLRCIANDLQELADKIKGAPAYDRCYFAIMVACQEAMRFINGDQPL